LRELGFGELFGEEIFVGLRGLELAEGFEGDEVGFAGGVDAALEAVEVFTGVLVALAKRELDIPLVEGVVVVMREELAFDGSEAAELPFVGDEVVDEAALFGRGGMEAVVIIAGEGFEFGGVLEREHGFGFGVDAGFEGVAAGGGFALRRAGAG
jgi:hypothetical protein